MLRLFSLFALCCVISSALSAADSVNTNITEQKKAWPSAVVAMRLSGADWDKLSSQYPILCDWVMQDTKGNPEKLINAQDGYATEKAIIDVVTGSLGADGKKLAAFAASSSNSEQRLAIYIKACELRRAMRLKVLKDNGISSFVYSKHYNMGGSHYAYTEGQSDAQSERNFQPGGALCRLRIDGLYGVEETLVQTDEGVIRNPDVSWDGKRILFSMKKADVTDDYHLYEYDLAAAKTRQITQGLGFVDYEGCYLPSGDILFNSTRCIQTVDCWWTEVSNMYTCNKDGQYMRRLAFDQVHDNFPTVMSDGRIVYTRWEYNDRGQLFPQPLFQMNQDGTFQTEFYGNNSWFPTTILHARGIPGTTQIIATLTGHHSHQAGKIAIIDPSKGREENQGVQLVAPLRDTPAVHIDAYGQDGDLFDYPYPINKNQFLVSYLPKGLGAPQPQAFGIYLMDTTGGRELLSWDSKISSNQPIPLNARPLPVIKPSAVDYTKNTGTYYLHDIYSGPGLKGISRGTVKKLRVVGLEYRAAGVKANYNAGPAGSATVSTPVGVDNTSWDPKTVLGEATIHEDGSAMFEVPVRRPVYFQAVDAKGEVVQTMRSWTTLQPGEKFSCMGCHEAKNSAPFSTSGRSMAMKSGVEQLKPFLRRPVRGFSFIKEIQPILDAHCIKCHDNRAERMVVGQVPDFKIEEAQTLSPKGADWFYTTDTPKSDWYTPNNKSSGWIQAQAGFGTNDIEGGLKSKWNTPDIWMRREFNASNSKNIGDLVCVLSHDEDVQLYLNGVKILDRESFITNYQTVVADPSAKAALKDGRNVLAVHCHQTIGGQYIDIGLYGWTRKHRTTRPFSLLGLPIPGDPVRRFTDSYISLTESGTSNPMVNWVSPQSAPPMLRPYSAGSCRSGLLDILDKGHGGVHLTQDERDTIACWIDLLVPFCGDYVEANTWNDDETEKYMYFFAKRKRMEATEARNIADYVRSLGKKPAVDVDAVHMEYISADQSGMLTQNDAQTPGRLTISHQYKPGDYVLVYGPKYVCVKLGSEAKDCILYNPEGVVLIPLPVRTGQAYPPSLTQAAEHIITARAATVQEIVSRRNLALNPYDVRGTSGSFPHATSNSECRNDPVFAARNAIDGFTHNTSHGVWPYQSWGPEQVRDCWWKVDFGRDVEVDSVTITVRADFPHDKVWNTGVLEFSDGSVQPIALKADAAPQVFTFAKRTTSYVRLNKLVQTEPLGWCAITEVEVTGNDKPQAQSSISGVDVNSDGSINVMNDQALEYTDSLCTLLPRISQLRKITQMAKLPSGAWTSILGNCEVVR